MEIENETGLCLEEHNIKFSLEENLMGLARDLTEGE